MLLAIMDFECAFKSFCVNISIFCFDTICMLDLTHIRISAQIGYYIPNTHIHITCVILCNTQVAVHCHAGLGRTGVLIASYLVYTWRCRPQDAIHFVRSRRLVLCVGRRFFRLLLLFHTLIPNSHIPTIQYKHTCSKRV